MFETISEPADGGSSDLAPELKWVRQTLPGSGTSIQDVTLVSGGYVVVGAVESDSRFDAGVWTSSDGVGWSVSGDEALGGPGGQSMRSVAFDGVSVVVVGQVNIVALTDFAESWALLDADESWLTSGDDPALFSAERNLGMLGVTSGGPGWVAVGFSQAEDDSDAAIWTSADGRSWSRAEDTDNTMEAPGRQLLTSITVGGGGFVAVGEADGNSDEEAAVWTSQDGQTWRRVASQPSLGGPGDQGMTDVVAGGPGFVAVGAASSAGVTNGAIWTSTDGLEWVRVPHDEKVFGGAAIFGVSASESLLVAVGGDNQGNGVVWTSSDGAAWTRSVIGKNANVPEVQVLFAVAIGTEQLVAVGYERSGDALTAAVWTGSEN